MNQTNPDPASSKENGSLLRSSTSTLTGTATSSDTPIVNNLKRYPPSNENDISNNTTILEPPPIQKCNSEAQDQSFQSTIPNTNSYSNKKKNRGIVADYFTILGTGDSLKIKKKEESNEVWKERFCREIVRIQFVSTSEFEDNSQYEKVNVLDTSINHLNPGTIPIGTSGSSENISPIKKAFSTWSRKPTSEPADLFPNCNDTTNPFVLCYKRRTADEMDIPAIADVELFYARVPKLYYQHNLVLSPVTSDTTSNVQRVKRLAFQAVNVKNKLIGNTEKEEKICTTNLSQWLDIPSGYDELILPSEYQSLSAPSCSSPPPNSNRTFLFSSILNNESSIEAITIPKNNTFTPDVIFPYRKEEESFWEEEFVPVPVLAIRRQRVGEEERFCEDAAIVGLHLSHCQDYKIIYPTEEDEENNELSYLDKTNWSCSSPKAINQTVVLYKKNIPSGFANVPFHTRVLDRFPRANYKHHPCPEEELPMFCYPTGCRLIRSQLSDVPLPTWYGFVVKNESGGDIYVSCVSFMEVMVKEKQVQLDAFSRERREFSFPHRCVAEKKSDILIPFDRMTTFETKTICLISRIPYWTAFRRFLLHLHLLSTSTSDIPLERYISHLLLAVPIPKPSRSIYIPLLSSGMKLSTPQRKDLPLLDLSFDKLLSVVDVQTTVMIVLGLLALERRLIVMSTHPSFVLDACELMRALLFPFGLCAPYVPRLTEPFRSCLDFPGAIFVGIHDDGMEGGLASTVRRELPEDCILIDLDTGEMDCKAEDKMEVLRQAWNIIPAQQRDTLIDEIESLCKDAGIVPGREAMDSQIDSAFPSEERLDDRAIRDAFLRFFCSILGGYERYLVVPDMDFLISGNEWFDARGFLASREPDLAKYLGSFVTTQLFSQFIQRRTEESDVHCVLFDECLVEYHAAKGGAYGRCFASACEDSMDAEDELYSLLVDQFAHNQEDNALEAYMLSSNATNPQSNSVVGSETDTSFTGLLANTSIAPTATTSTIHTSHSLDTSIEDSSFLSQKKHDIIITTPSREFLPPTKRFVYCIDGFPCFPTTFNTELFFPKEPEELSADNTQAPVPVLTRSDGELEEAMRRRRIASSNYGCHSNQRRCLWQLPKLMASHVLGAWLMCIPSQVSQADLAKEDQTRYLLRALGAIRMLRARQKVIPDEAAYRCLMVACGRTDSDRRVELVKLFGLLRHDGIFPSAVTLGQYTRAIADGFSKRSVENSECSYSKVEIALNQLDETLSMLEESGKRWRQSPGREESPEKHSDDKKRKHHSSWSPISYSTSFLPQTESLSKDDVTFIALWSRTSACEFCSYIPLDEEIQSGWEDDDANVLCPRCRNSIKPMLGYRFFTWDEAMAVGVPRKSSSMQNLPVSDSSLQGASFDTLSTCTYETNEGIARYETYLDTTLRQRLSPVNFIPSGKTNVKLPPQLQASIKNQSQQPSPSSSDNEFSQPNESSGYVPYLSPSTLRSCLEKLMEEHGECVFERETLKQLDLRIYCNLWWYCARFSLPLPLSTTQTTDDSITIFPQNTIMRHECCFISWDQSVAQQGCSAGAESFEILLKSFTQLEETRNNMNLLSYFNLQNYAQDDWEHTALSSILVSLVDACDKRDFRTVLQHAHDLNLDPYRTILYLARYQCTSAFHAFFPTTCKACKGYHFWCVNGNPLPMFDRLFREAVAGTELKVNVVEDVALGYRCVFGHLI